MLYWGNIQSLISDIVLIKSTTSTQFRVHVALSFCKSKQKRGILSAGGNTVAFGIHCLDFGAVNGSYLEKDISVDITLKCRAKSSPFKGHDLFKDKDLSDKRSHVEER